MTLTRKEIVFLRNAVSTMIEAHRAGWSIADITKNKNMQVFHGEAIELGRSLDDRLLAEETRLIAGAPYAARLLRSIYLRLMSDTAALEANPELMRVTRALLAQIRFLSRGG